MTAFIEEYRDVFGVEPICKLLPNAPSTCYERKAIARDPDRASRRVWIATHPAAILRARRKRLEWGPDEHEAYTRHRWRVEGAHGTAKKLHGSHRAIRRGLQNMKIQSRLTALAMNLKKLAREFFATLLIYLKAQARYRFVHQP